MLLLCKHVRLTCGFNKLMMMMMMMMTSFTPAADAVVHYFVVYKSFCCSGSRIEKLYWNGCCHSL